MYARSTTIQAQPSSIDAGIAHFRDQIMPAVQKLDGYVGISLLVDRQSGQCITTTAWESEDAMRASADRASQLRDRAAQEFGGNIETVEGWEIAVMHRRSQDGACVRATMVQLPPDQVDAGVEFYKSRVLSEIEELEGFCAATLLIDRGSGRSVSAVTFASREAMDRNRQQSTELKNARIKEVGAEELNEGEYDLALADLRVPEVT